MAGGFAKKLRSGCRYGSILTENGQAYMVFKGIDFITISSNNHASPTGALPFILPASSSNTPGEAVLPVPSTRIERWTREKNVSTKTAGTSSDERWKRRSQRAEASASTKQEPASKESLELRYEAYMSLVNYRIRNAYVGLTSVLHSSVN